MPSPLRLNLAGNLPVRVPGITWTLDGQLTDPRELVTVAFQLVPADGTTEEDGWVDGAWEAFAPDNGPYAATITVGVGQEAGLNPGVTGTFSLQMRLSSDMPSQSIIQPVGFVLIVEQ